MENAQNNRDQLYKAAPENVKAIYAGEDTGELLWQVALKIGLTDAKLYRVFALAVGDVILGVYKKNTLPELLKTRVKLSDEQIETVTSELAPLLQKLSEPPVTNTPVIFRPPTLTDGTGIEDGAANKPATTNGGVKPLRTFAMDVDVSRAHGYGAFRSGEDNEGDEPVHHSSQDDIIKK